LARALSSEVNMEKMEIIINLSLENLGLKYTCWEDMKIAERFCEKIKAQLTSLYKDCTIYVNLLNYNSCSTITTKVQFDEAETKNALNKLRGI
jgi:hypothetical protein